MFRSALYGVCVLCITGCIGDSAENQPNNPEDCRSEGVSCEPGFECVGDFDRPYACQPTDGEREAVQDIESNSPASSECDAARNAVSSGIIGSDLRLKRECSPFQLPSSGLEIQESALLTIDAGVILLTDTVMPDASMVVRGTLTANGERDAPIVIGPSPGEMASGWTGIRLSGRGSSLNHFHVTGARDGLTVEETALETSLGHIAIDDGEKGLSWRVDASLSLVGLSLSNVSTSGLEVFSSTQPVDMNLRELTVTNFGPSAAGAVVMIAAPNEDSGPQEPAVIKISNAQFENVSGQILNVSGSHSTIELTGWEVSGVETEPNHPAMIRVGGNAREQDTPSVVDVDSGAPHLSIRLTDSRFSQVRGQIIDSELWGNEENPPPLLTLNLSNIEVSELSAHANHPAAIRVGGNAMPVDSEVHSQIVMEQIRVSHLGGSFLEIDQAGAHTTLETLNFNNVNHVPDALWGNGDDGLWGSGDDGLWGTGDDGYALPTFMVGQNGSALGTFQMTGGQFDGVSGSILTLDAANIALDDLVVENFAGTVDHPAAIRVGGNALPVEGDNLTGIRVGGNALPTTQFTLTNGTFTQIAGNALLIEAERVSLGQIALTDCTPPVDDPTAIRVGGNAISPAQVTVNDVALVQLNGNALAGETQFVGLQINGAQTTAINDSAFAAGIEVANPAESVNFDGVTISEALGDGIAIESAPSSNAGVQKEAAVNVVVSRTSVSGAGRGFFVSGALDMRVHIRESELSRNRRAGLWTAGVRVEAVSVQVFENKDDGIHVEGQLLLDNSLIYGNAGDGVEVLAESDAEIILVNSTIDHNGWQNEDATSGITIHARAQLPTVLIQNNIVTCSYGTGVMVTGTNAEVVSNNVWAAEELCVGGETQLYDLESGQAQDSMCYDPGYVRPHRPPQNGMPSNSMQNDQIDYGPTRGPRNEGRGRCIDLENYEVVRNGCDDERPVELGTDLRGPASDTNDVTGGSQGSGGTDETPDTMIADETNVGGQGVMDGGTETNSSGGAEAPLMGDSEHEESEDERPSSGGNDETDGALVPEDDNPDGAGGDSHSQADAHAGQADEARGGTSWSGGAEGNSVRETQFEWGPTCQVDNDDAQEADDTMDFNGLWNLDINDDGQLDGLDADLISAFVADSCWTQDNTGNNLNSQLIASTTQCARRRLQSELIAYLAEGAGSGRLDVNGIEGINREDAQLIAAYLVSLGLDLDPSEAVRVELEAFYRTRGAPPDAAREYALNGMLGFPSTQDLVNAFEALSTGLGAEEICEDSNAVSGVDENRSDDPVCGNGIIEEGEACDANSDSSTCTPHCQLATTFHSRWSAHDEGRQIRIVLDRTAPVDFVIDWGDGRTTTVDSNFIGDAAEHTYQAAGIKNVTLIGRAGHLIFDCAGPTQGLAELQEVINLGDLGWHSFENTFRGCQALTTVSGGEVEEVTTMAGMFDNAVNVSVDTHDWDTSQVTNMSRMFFGTAIAAPDTGTWNTGRVTSMESMFEQAGAANPATADWDTSSVNTMRAMFRDAVNANPATQNWSTARVTDMSAMFEGAAVAVPQTDNWQTRQVQDMSLMFAGATSALPSMTGWSFEGLQPESSPQGAMGAMFTDLTLSTDVYSAFLIALESQSVADNGTLGGGFSQFSLLAAPARQRLIDNHGWTITDGGLATSPTCGDGILDAEVGEECDDMRASDLCSEQCQRVKSFISEWETTEPGEGVALLLGNSLADFTIDWGDGSPIAHVDQPNDPDLEHVYAQAGRYEVVIDGQVGHLKMNCGAEAVTVDRVRPAELSDVWNLGDVDWSSLEATFESCEMLKTVQGGVTDNVTSMRRTFLRAGRAEPDTATWNTASVTTMREAFSSARRADPSTGHWDTSKVTDMGSMFYGALDARPDTSSWDTSKVTDMSSMFTYAQLATPDTRNWNTGEVQTMARMFARAERANPDTSEWDTSKVITMYEMFEEAVAANPNTSDWNTAQVTNMSGMFDGAEEANPDVSQWDTSAVINMALMFRRATIATPDTRGWNTARVQRMYGMFSGAVAADPDTSQWNTAMVEDMATMFSGAVTARPDTTNWNTARVQRMSAMFSGAVVADPDTSQWNTSSVETMAVMFEGAVTARPDTSNWNTSNVTDMASMFRRATAANPSTANWDTSAVINMRSMFEFATSAAPVMANWNFSQIGQGDGRDDFWGMDQMFTGVTLPTENYSALLIGLANTVVASNKTLDGGMSRYSAAAEAAVTHLTEILGWTIRDAGPAEHACGIDSDCATGYACKAGTCKLPMCGDGFLDAGEECDGGGEDDLCDAQCKQNTAFASKWIANAENATIRFNFPPTDNNNQPYVYGFTIDWGDDTPPQWVSEAGVVTHTYSNTGGYTLTMSTDPETNGQLPHFQANCSENGKFQLTQVTNLGKVGWRNLKSAFRGCTALQSVVGGDTSMVTDMSSMFAQAPEVQVHTSNWDTGQVTDMAFMFDGASQANPDTSGWSTGNVLTMRSMFNAAVNAQPDMASWDFTQVTDMTNMLSEHALDENVYAGLISTLSNADELQIGVTLDAGASRLTDPTDIEKKNLIVSRWRWTINDADGSGVESSAEDNGFEFEN